MSNSSTTYQTLRFGEIEFTDHDVITIEGGILGFQENSRYLILQHKEGSPFRWLQSLEQSALAFLVVDPAAYTSEYSPEMDERHAVELELTEETPQLVYTIVTIPKGKPEEMSLNLAGPIVVNCLTRQAKQIVLEHPAYPIKFYPSQNTPQTEGAVA
jgi:flagellar assembly factor FliW